MQLMQEFYDELIADVLKRVCMHGPNLIINENNWSLHHIVSVHTIQCDNFI